MKIFTKKKKNTMKQVLPCLIQSMAQLFLYLKVTPAKCLQQDVTNSLSAAATHFNPIEL